MALLVVLYGLLLPAVNSAAPCSDMMSSHATFSLGTLADSCLGKSWTWLQLTWQTAAAATAMETC
jgi:hypothetical protein